MTGKIVKGIAGFYYVHVLERGVYECRAKGIFRKDRIKPLVGDNVEIDVLDEQEKTGNLISILPRKNTLVRPAVANIDQALVIFAVHEPKPNLNLLNRFLVMMERQQVDTAICFNKEDLGADADCRTLREVYAGCKSPVLFASAHRGEGIEELQALLWGKTTTVAGPSGVGKSSLINLLCPHANMETGEISRKIDRGRHTTRHSELFHIREGAYLLDTPGFSSLYLPDMEARELSGFFPEFAAYEPKCRFQGCLHDREPDCGVKRAVEKGEISELRYESYVDLLYELKDRRKY